MITLFLGGARSGKSVVAERYVVTLPPPVTYVATYVGVPDPDMAARIAAHRARRPLGWRLREVGAGLPVALEEIHGTVLLDSLGTWVAGSAVASTAVAGTPGFAVDAGALCRALSARVGDTVVVSEEVGLGVHPSSVAGREFRDALGQVNEEVAAVADDVWLVVAGRTLALARAVWP